MSTAGLPTLPTETLETARLEIRPFALSDSDADAVFSWMGDPAARRYTAGAQGREASDRGLRETVARVNATGLGARAVVERASGEVLGYCGLQRFAETEDVELFYGYRRSAWGRGYATEAATALVELADRSVGGGDGDGVSRLVAIVHPDNAASQRVLDKVGFAAQGTYLHPARPEPLHVFLVRTARPGG